MPQRSSQNGDDRDMEYLLMPGDPVGEIPV